MFIVRKRMEIAGCHQLNLSYESPCQRLHGHNWIIEVELKGKKLNEEGMLADFKWLKSMIHGKLDHQFLNELFPFNPTAENIAKWICDSLNEKLIHCYCSEVKVQESEGNIAIYIKEDE